MLITVFSHRPANIASHPRYFNNDWSDTERQKVKCHTMLPGHVSSLREVYASEGQRKLYAHTRARTAIILVLRVPLCDNGQPILSVLFRQGVIHRSSFIHSFDSFVSSEHQTNSNNNIEIILNYSFLARQMQSKQKSHLCVCCCVCEWIWNETPATTNRCWMSLMTIRSVGDGDSDGGSALKDSVIDNSHNIITGRCAFNLKI